MHTLARPLVRENRLHLQSGSRAFTLIELLTVIGIIAILAAITFGVVKGVQERAAIGQARTELAVLAQALEGYKRQYGDYPQIAIDNSTGTTGGLTCGKRLFKALNGQIGPVVGSADLNPRLKVWIETAKFTVADTTVADTAENYLLDPWGRAYRYAYKPASTWKNPSYVLFSVGPDGEMTDIPTDGILTDTAYYNKTKAVGTSTVLVNADNIFANK